jgi:coenzyme F420-reducing hydrogenase delta subunit
MGLTDKQKYEIVVLYCGRSLKAGEYVAEGKRDHDGYTARFIQVPCSSEVRTEFLIKLVDEGADGVLLIACPENKCRFMVGSTHAASRINYARKLVAETGMEAARVRLEYHQELTLAELVALGEAMADNVRAMESSAANTPVGEGE